MEKQKYCDLCSSYFNTYKELMKHGFDKCVKCNENVQHPFSKNAAIDNNVRYGYIYTWDIYEHSSYALIITDEDKIEYKHPIEISGSSSSIYLSKIELPEGYICPDCFEILESEDKIVHKWTYQNK